MRSPPQKVTGYRYEEETACEQRLRDFRGGYCGPPHVSLLPLPAPLRPSRASLRCCALVSQLLFFDASSFLIAANRDVKTIRALLLDSSNPMLNSFRSRCRSPLFAHSLPFPPRLCLWRNVLGAFSRDPFAITRRVRFESEEKLSSVDRSNPENANQEN